MNHNKSYILKIITILALCTLQTCHSGIIKNALRTYQTHVLTSASAAWLGWQGYTYITSKQNNSIQQQEENSQNDANWLINWANTPWHTKLKQITSIAIAGYLVYQGVQLFSIKQKAVKIQVDDYPVDTYYEIIEPFLYKATKDNHTTYLLGTHHRPHSLHPLVEEAINKSQSYTTEVTTLWSAIAMTDNKSIPLDTHIIRTALEKKFDKASYYSLENEPLRKKLYLNKKDKKPDTQSTIETLNNIQEYVQGNTMWLIAFIQQYCKDTELNARNQAWIPTILSIHNKHVTNFIAFGAAHLYGQCGIIPLLRKTGYTIKRISQMSDL